MNTVNQARSVMYSNSITAIEIAFEKWVDGDFLNQSTKMFSYNEESFIIHFTDDSLLISDKNGVRVA